MTGVDPPDDLANAIVEASLFDEKGRLVVPAAGRRLRDAGHLCMGHDGRLYRWVDGVYVGDGDAWAKERLRDLLGAAWRRSHADEVLAWLRAGPVFITATPSREYLNVTNGLLRLRDLTLREHNPEIASAVQIAARWDPTAGCPSWTTFLDQVLPGVAADFIYELIGYTLYPANPYAKAVMALGAGANGKSVMLAVLRALLGRENFASIPLQELAENRFAKAELFGKLANICGDIDARAIRRTDLFKQITGGDPISAERKYGHPFTFTAFATPWFSANEPPLTSDQTDAWFRRWIILPFTVSFTKDEADPFLIAKLTTAEELSGVLLEAVHGLRRLMERGYFELPDIVETAGNRYRDRLDTVRGYVDEECVLRPEAWVARTDLYRAYKEWCSDGGRMALSAATFNERLQRDYPEIRATASRGERRWAGIGRRSGLEAVA